MRTRTHLDARRANSMPMGNDDGMKGQDGGDVQPNGHRQRWGGDRSLAMHTFQFKV